MKISGWRRIVPALTIGTVIGVVVAGCGSEPSPSGDGDRPFEGQTLRVAVWGGSWTDVLSEVVGEKFEEDTGATVEYVPSEPGASFAQILSAQGSDPGFDIGTFDDVQIPQLVERNLIHEIDPQLAPNIEGAYDEATIVPGYTPALTWLRLALGYNTEKFEELGINTPPDSWEVMWDERLAGRVAVPASGSTAALPMLIMANQIVGNSDLSDLEPGYEKLATLDINQVFESASALDPQVAAGDVWAYVTAPARVYQIQEQGYPIDLVYPELAGKKGILSRSTSMQIPASASNEKVALAHEFINYHFDPELLAEMMLETGGEPTVAAAIELMVEKDPSREGRYVTPENIGEVFVPDLDVIIPQMPAMADNWRRTFTG